MPSARFVDAAVAALRSLGLEVSTLDLEEASVDEAARALDLVDLIFFTGGYVMYLLQHLQRTELTSALAIRVNSGELAYAGISAGAAMAGPDLAPLRDPDDPGVVSSTEGLGIVPFVVLSHRNRGRAEYHDQVAATRSSRFSFVSLNDDQAVVVEHGSWEVRPSA
jgi:peptidase E